MGHPSSLPIAAISASGDLPLINQAPERIADVMTVLYRDKGHKAALCPLSPAPGRKAYALGQSTGNKGTVAEPSIPERSFEAVSVFAGERIPVYSQSENCECAEFRFRSDVA